MKTRTLLVTLWLSLIATVANAQWAVVSLHPAGATGSKAYDVSGGQQVGQAWVAGGNYSRACLWSGTASSRIDLTPAGGVYSTVQGVFGGKQVGYTTFQGDQRASLWSGTAASWIDLTPATATASAAHGAGDGQQVGFAFLGGVRCAGLWNSSPASWVNLHPTAATRSVAVGVTSGQQVGSAVIGGVEHASLWTSTANSWVDLHPAGASYSGANAIGGGQQVGWASFGGVRHAGLWTGTALSWVDLHPAGVSESIIIGVSSGYQVGVTTVGSYSHASMWTGTAGSHVSLHSYLPVGFLHSSADGIWQNLGSTFIVGFGYNSNTGLNEALMWMRPGPTDFMLTLNKSNVSGQNSVQGTILMGDTKATNTVFTTYDNSSLVTTPPSVTVPAGAYSRTFQITVTAITSTVVTTIFARRGTLTRSQTLTLTPLIPTALIFTPNPVTGGQPTSCRVVINGVAGPGGRVIAIFDNSPYATTPSTVTVPGGATDVSFTITTIPVTSTKTVTVTARVSAGEKTGTFRINP